MVVLDLKTLTAPIGFPQERKIATNTASFNSNWHVVLLIRSFNIYSNRIQKDINEQFSLLMWLLYDRNSWHLKHYNQFLQPGLEQRLFFLAED